MYKSNIAKVCRDYNAKNKVKLTLQGIAKEMGSTPQFITNICRNKKVQELMFRVYSSPKPEVTYKAMVKLGIPPIDKLDFIRKKFNVSIFELIIKE